MEGHAYVRVLHGRNIQKSGHRPIFGWSSTALNLYCQVSLSTTAGFTGVSSTVDPSWTSRNVLSFRVPIPVERRYECGSEYKLDSGVYDPEFPVLVLKLYHREATDKNCIIASVDERKDILIGRASVSILPAILSRTSSMKQWITVYEPTTGVMQGELLLSIQYDPGGKNPLKGDTIRILSYGGTDRHTKVLPLHTKLQVSKVQGDHVYGIYQSPEKWTIQMELYRNDILVVNHQDKLCSTPFDYLQIVRSKSNTYLGEQNTEKAVQLGNELHKAGSNLFICFTNITSVSYHTPSSYVKNIKAEIVSTCTKIFQNLSNMFTIIKNSDQ